MNKDNSYLKRVEFYTPPSPLYKNALFAFLFGGGICALGEGLFFLFSRLGAQGEAARCYVTISLIFLSSLLTGLGVYDRLSKVGGAGTLVPVTGFANAVVSPAMDAKGEGLVLGTASKIFTVAGPVLLFGTLAGMFYGLVLFVWQLF